MKINNAFNIVSLFWWAKTVALWGGSHCEEVAVSKNPQGAKKVSFTASSQTQGRSVGSGEKVG